MTKIFILNSTIVNSLEKSIECLGHVIRPERLVIASHTTGAERVLQEPTIITELRFFFGSCNSFWRFAPNFVRLAALQNRTLWKHQPPKFRPLKAKDFSSLNLMKKEPVLLPELALLNSTGQIALDAVTRDMQDGCEIQRNQENERSRLMWYWSHTLNGAKKRYGTTQRDCLAIVWFVFIIRPDIKRTKRTTLTVWTNENSLERILNKKRGPVYLRDGNLVYRNATLT